ncbi:MAG: hypothetical protein ABIT96_01385 [Ferruginibacter sp.]
MKKSHFLCLLITCFLFSACKKSNSTVEIKYEVTVSAPAAFTAQYTLNNSSYNTEAVTGLTWQKIISAFPVESGGAPTVVKLVLYPPASWAGTANSATVTLKILKNGTEISQVSDVINASHISLGVYTIASF